MKDTMSKALWGVFFVLLGISMAGKAIGVFDFNIFFPGWWTLFIIVPSAIGLFNSENRTASVFGLGVGILLLAGAQGIVGWYTFPRLIISLIFVVIGCSFLFRKNRRSWQEDYRNDNTSYGRTENQYDSYNNSQNNYNSQGGNGGQDNGNEWNTGPNYNDPNYNGSNNYSSDSSYGSQNSGNAYHGTNHGGYNHYTGFLSGRNIQFVEEEFKGAEVTSILGNVQLDLRNAILNDDVVIETTCILGGVDVYVPGNVKVVLNCTPILGGVENKVIAPYNATGNIYTIFIRGTCILGGIEVR